jgi:peroxiredoxin
MEENLGELAKQGVRPVAISADTSEESAKLCKKAGYTYTFLSDRNAEVIRQYDLLHAKAGEDGRDISRPAEFLLDGEGVVRWRNLTEDFRVRATGEDVLKAAQGLK